MLKYIIILLSINSFADVDIFQRELNFVSSQRQTLEKQLNQLRSSKQKHLAELNRKLDELHKDKAYLTTELEATENEANDLNRILKKQSQSQSLLADRMAWIKTKNTELAYFAPNSENSKKESEASLADLLNQEAQLITSLSQVFVSQKSYLDLKQSLNEGVVFQVGPFAHFLSQDGHWSILTLTNNGHYQQTKELSFTSEFKSEQPFAAAAFVQLPFSKTFSLMKEKNFFNTVMDLLPAIFLALVFFAIGWIFIQLAKS